MKISVCLAAYNGKAYIRDQLLSILNQLGPDDEIILSDDGSTDKTLEIVRGLDDRRIRIVFGPGKGVVENFLFAIEAACGDIVFLSDQDDVWASDRVSSVLPFHKSFDCIAVDLFLCDASVDPANNYPKFSSKLIPSHSVMHTFIRNRHPGCSLSMTRRFVDLLSNAGCMRVPMHDWYFILLAQFLDTFYYHDKPLVYFRRHSNNNSSSGDISNYKFISKVKMRIRLVAAVTHFLLKRQW